ncbi:glycoside hydrolase family 93 protein [Schizophyllum fasciatum]
MAYPSFLRVGLLFCAASSALTAFASPLAPRAPPLVPHVNGESWDISPDTDGAYPRVALLADGTLLGSYEATASGIKKLWVSRSTDGGKTFSAHGSISESPGDTDNAFLIERPDGAILAAFRNHDLDGNRNPTYYRLTLCISKDGGANWEFLTHITERAATPDHKNGVWEPFMRYAKDGTLQVYYASENRDDDQDILLQTSTDGGASWSGTSIVAGATTTGRDGMPGVAEFDGGLICVFETTEGRNGKFIVKSVISTDDGANWGQRSEVYVPADAGRNAGAPQVATTTTGTLVTSFMTDEDGTELGWPDKGANFKIVTKAPGGDRWEHKTEVFGIQATWPGLLAKTDGSVLGCSGHSGEGSVCHEITFSE